MRAWQDDGVSSIELVIETRRRSIGFGYVDRLLPFRLRRMVGPFIFLDLMGPDEFAPGSGTDVPPHPHIGLATLTYLSEGSLVHRDSTGAVQRIDPGDVNWMHAGRGIVHSERTPAEQRQTAHTLAGAQFWVALPAADEDSDPFFEHHPVETLPAFATGDAQTRLVAGSAFGRRSPVTTASPLCLAASTFAAAGRSPLPDDHAELAVLVLDGDVTIDGEPVAPRTLAVLAGTATEIHAAGPADVLVLGGDPVGNRKIWWNFVASNQERIDDAKQRWLNEQFAPIEGETERVPLPA